MLTWLTMLFQKIEGSNILIAIIGAMWVLYLGFFFVVKEKHLDVNLKKKFFALAFDLFFIDFTLTVSLIIAISKESSV